MSHSDVDGIVGLPDGAPLYDILAKPWLRTLEGLSRGGFSAALDRRHSVQKQSAILAADVWLLMDGMDGMERRWSCAGLISSRTLWRSWLTASGSEALSLSRRQPKKSPALGRSMACLSDAPPGPSPASAGPSLPNFYFYKDGRQPQSSRATSCISASLRLPLPCSCKSSHRHRLR